MSKNIIYCREYPLDAVAAYIYSVTVITHNFIATIHIITNYIVITHIVITYKIPEESKTINNDKLHPDFRLLSNS